MNMNVTIRPIDKANHAIAHVFRAPAANAASMIQQIHEMLGSNRVYDLPCMLFLPGKFVFGEAEHLKTLVPSRGEAVEIITFRPLMGMTGGRIAKMFLRREDEVAIALTRIAITICAIGASDATSHYKRELFEAVLDLAMLFDNQLTD